MEKYYFAIYDQKAEVYTDPFIQPSISTAIRALDHEFEEKTSMLARYPEDYALYLLGVFDTKTGIFVPEGVDPSRTLPVSEGHDADCVDWSPKPRFIVQLSHLKRPFLSVSEKRDQLEPDVPNEMLC